MAEWFVAPDGAVKTGLTFATIGSGGYGTAWNKAVKWSDFQAGSGAWANRNNGDTFHFLSCNKPFLISNGAGWVALTLNKTGVTFVGETIDGRKSVAVFKGTRDWPWPKAGQSAAYAGEVFLQISVAAAATVFDHLAWRNMKTATTPNAGSNLDIGQITYKDCHTTNVSRGIMFTEGRSDGRCNVVVTNCDAHGYDKGNLRIWANNAAVALSQTDCYWDSEHQNDNSNYNNASTPSGANVFDSRPETQTVKTPMAITRVVSVNHRAGYTSPGSGYPQGDGFIGEENVGTFTGRDILTWGNGDRGIDLKCAGVIARYTSFGDGTAAIAHHLDTIPIDVYHSVLYAGARLTTSNSPPSVACIQASGWLRAFSCWLDSRPTAAQQALSAYGVTNASVDPSKWQHADYGGVHQGNVELHDTYLRYQSSTGAAEQVGYAGAGVNGRSGFVFGLAASSTRHFAVRALGPDWAAGVATSAITFAMSPDGGGERTGPGQVQNFVASAAADGRDILCTWDSLAEDAGTSIQGYLVEVDAGDGAGFVPFLPGKSRSPLTLSGFRKGHAYVLRIRAFDNNMNVSATPSATQNVTTTAGSDVNDTPGTPTNCGVDAGWVAHVTCAGIGHPTSVGAGFTAPATGTVAIYEVLDTDAGNAVVSRMGSIRLSSQDTPTYAKTNAHLLAV